MQRSCRQNIDSKASSVSQKQFCDLSCPAHCAPKAKRTPPSTSLSFRRSPSPFVLSTESTTKNRVLCTIARDAELYCYNCLLATFYFVATVLHHCQGTRNYAVCTRNRSAIRLSRFGNDCCQFHVCR